VIYSRPLLLLLFCLCGITAAAQGDFFGGLQFNSDFYVRDSTVNAIGTPHYDNLKSSSDGWFDLNYNNNKYELDAGIRFDLFNNSNLHNPGTPYSAQGIGRFYIRKRINDFRITAGHFYDQFGSGIIFRAYEDRFLGIDNAILGLHVEYTPIEKVRIKAFTGVQKNRFSIYKPIIKGLNAEYNTTIKKATIITGIGAVNRTLDQESMNLIVSAIETYAPADRFVPRYNDFAFSLYNTLNVWKLSWYVEGAYKTREAIPDENGKLIDRSGNVVYSTLSYSTKGFGVSGSFKRTQNWFLRTSPNEQLLNGMISFIPPITRQNSLRLPARYNAATQELEELAYSLEATYTPKAGYTIMLNASEVRDFNKTLLFREVFAELDWKVNKKWRIQPGIQYIEYNQLFYEEEAYTPDRRRVTAFTPFVEIIYNINRKHSVRMELQDQITDEDFGHWAYALLEYSISPHFSFAVTDMYNYKPNPGRVKDDNHYFSVFSAFTWKANRFTLAYVRQVEGVVCTGGVCRLEPAFSGVRLTLNTTF
jgi:hypothetical protein